MSFATGFRRLRARRVSTTLLGFVSVSAALTSQAHAHIDVTNVEPRGGNNSDQKTGPCPDLPRGEPLEFEAGSTMTLEWTETVDHDGNFVISFDPDGDDFDGDGDGNDDFPASLGGNDEASGNGDLVLMVIPDEGGSEHSAEVTLPATACDNCTLQLMQNMGERTPTAGNPTAHLYFRCIDLVLVGGDGGNTGGSGGMAGGSTGGGGIGGSLVGGFGGMMVGMAGQTEPGLVGVGGTTLVAPGGMPGTPPLDPPTGPTPEPMPTTPATVTPMSPEPGQNPPVVPPEQADPIPPTQPMSSNGAPAASSSAPPSASTTASAGDGNGGDDSGCSVSPKAASLSSAMGIFSLLALCTCLLRRRHRSP